MKLETFSYPLKFERSEKVVFRSIKIPFGDGYSQRLGRGINKKRSVWSARAILQIKEAEKVIAFFDRHGDYTPFLWKHPDTGELITVYLDEGYENRFIAPNVKELSNINFVQVYGIDHE